MLFAELDTNQKDNIARPPGSNTMVSSLDTLDPVTAVQMESLEHQSTSEHYSQDYGVQEPDSDTERLVSKLLIAFTTTKLAVMSKSI